MNLAEKAFKELFPEKYESRRFEVKYSKKFSKYNANVKYNKIFMRFNLSYDWKEISEEIQMGLIQSLLLKIYKEKNKTINLDLYQKFVKNIPKFSITTKVDPFLEESFNRVNEKYFYGFIDLPNLVWGQLSFRKLGSYDYLADTITMSKIMIEDEELLDYVMYHELLHKKLQFYTKNGRNYHHTTEFRKKEKEFDNPNIDEKLKSFLARKRMKKLFKFW